MKLAASASIVRGKTTNRVRVRNTVIDPSPQRALHRFRKDPSTRGRVYVTICICLPVDELAVIDETAERIEMARSHFLREAAKRFVKVPR